MTDKPDDPQTPKKPAGKRIKLGLFLPWNKSGRLFNEEKFLKKDTESGDVPLIDDKILHVPDEAWKQVKRDDPPDPDP